MKKILSILLFIPLVAGLALYTYFPKAHADGTELLSSPWTISASGGSSEKYQSISPTVLQNQSSIQVTYNLHGTCLLDGDASAIIFDQSGWKYVSLSHYGQNCLDGSQTVAIPLSDFHLDTTAPVGDFHVRFWSNSSYTIDIASVKVMGGSASSATSAPTATPTPTSSPTPAVSTTPTSTVSPTPTVTTAPTPAPTSSSTQSSGGSFAIQSVDAMKDTKDAICGQHPSDWINKWLDKAVEIGANYVAISTPYDNPSCGDSLAYTKVWVNAIRAHGLHVWHRHMPLSFEGIYNVSKNNSSNYLDMIKNYITQNPDLFQDGDIFAPIPEPQNGGIQNITYCANNVCQFSSKEQFNQWLRDAMTTSTQAFQSIGKSGVKVGYFGFDGFVAWGDTNPDWHGILEDSTVKQMGNITIDHYPELVHETMDQGLTALQQKYPNTPIIIGEWGTVDGKNVDQEVMDDMGAAKNHHVTGFNYWQFGPSGSGEQLINTDFSERSSFSKVESFYKG